MCVRVCVCVHVCVCVCVCAWVCVFCVCMGECVKELDMCYVRQVCSTLVVVGMCGGLLYSP